MTLESVLTDAMTLSPRERALLADELWRSVSADEKSLALTSAQREDLQRRLAEDAAGQSDPQPWARVRSALRRRA
jgi:putative addiction module component (TIGR02574 family)